MDDILAHQGIPASQRSVILSQNAATPFTASTTFTPPSQTLATAHTINFPPFRRMNLSIGIGGKKRHGKDTLAHLLIAADPDTAWVTFGMSDALFDFLMAQNPWVYVEKPVFYSPPTSYRRVLAIGHYRFKEIIRTIGYERAKDEIADFRDLLKLTGTEAGRNVLFDTLWVDKAEEHIRQLWDAGKSVILTSTRFANERALIKRLGGTTVLVERLGYEDDGDTHASESDMNPDAFDYHVQASTLAELEQAARDIITITKEPS